MGLSSVMCQSIIFREFLVILYGNELILGFILFAWLFSIAIGAGVFRLLDRFIKNPGRAFLNAVFIFSVLPSALIPLIRSSRSFLGVDYGLYIPFFKTAFFSYAIIFPLAFLVGFTFPLGCRILADATAVSRIYMTESAGSMAGGLLFSFILVRLLPAPHIASLIFIFFSISIIAFRIFSHKSGISILEPKSIALFILCILSVVWSPQIEKTTVLRRWKTLVRDLPLISSINSPYQNLALTRQMDQFSVYFNGIYGYSFPDDYGDATSAHHIMTQSLHPKNVLIIGEVTPGFIGECLKHPVEKMTCIYFDPALARLMNPFITDKEKGILENKRVKIIFRDGRPFIKSTLEKFDLVYLNLPDPSNALINRYYTVEFFSEVSQKIKPGGVLAVGLTSSENYMGGDVLDYNLTIHNTLKKVFPFISICPATPSYFFASRSREGASDDWQVLFRRFNERNIKDTIFTPYIFESLYDPGRVKFKKQTLKKSSDAPINSDMSPVAYLYNLKLWDQYSDSRLSPLIEFIEKMGIGFWLGLLGVVTSFYLLYIAVLTKEKGKPFRAILEYTVFTTGVISMGLTFILLFSYQNLYGYLYEKMGFVVSLFMLGLFIGGAYSYRLIKNNRVQNGYIKILLLLLVIISLVIPSIMRILNSLPVSWVPLFYCLFVLVGILSGQVFPLCTANMSDCGSKIEDAASRLDAADHLGGCFGAILLGAFLVPLLGVALSTVLLAALQASALILWGGFQIKYGASG